MKGRARVLLSCLAVSACLAQTPEGHERGEAFTRALRDVPVYVPLAWESLPAGPRGRKIIQSNLSYTSDEEWSFLSDDRKRPVIRIGVTTKNGVLVVRRVELKAARRKIAPGARLIRVGDEDAAGLSPEDLAKLLREHERFERFKQGPGVPVTVLNPGAKELTTAWVPRAWAPGGRRDREEDVWAAELDAPKTRRNVGYLRVHSAMSPEAAQRARVELDRLLEGGVAGLILDLRDSHGLTSLAPELAGAFVPKGTHLYDTRLLKEEGIVVKRVTVEEGRQEKLSIPVVVLINSGTGSGCELLACALADSGGAVTLGQTSFGDGLIRAARHIDEFEGYLYVPIGEHVRTNGRPLFEVGLRPEIEVSTPRETLFFLTDDASRDGQLQAALKLIETKPVEAR